ncbi:hypothetical protein DOE76_00005, partial [Leifsonia sp. ku-ls]
MPDLRLALPAAALWVTCALLIGATDAAWAVVAVCATGAVLCVGLAAIARLRSGRPAARRLAARRL